MCKIQEGRQSQEFKNNLFVFFYVSKRVQNWLCTESKEIYLKQIE